MATTTTLTRALILAGLIPLLAPIGCGGGGDGGSDPAYSLTLSSAPPIDVEISRAAITLPVGVVARIQAVDAEGSPIGLEPDDRAVLNIETTPTAGELVIIGVAPGETCVEIILRDGGAPCIPATVIEQP